MKTTVDIKFSQTALLLARVWGFNVTATARTMDFFGINPSGFIEAHAGAIAKMLVESAEYKFA